MCPHACWKYTNGGLSDHGRLALRIGWANDQENEQAVSGCQDHCIPCRYDSLCRWHRLVLVFGGDRGRIDRCPSGLGIHQPLKLARFPSCAVSAKSFPMGEAANANERFIAIQALRFVAALLVVFHHCRLQATFFDGAFDYGRYIQGHTGVDIFFVISGFIAVWITRYRDRHPLTFVAGRFLRVWPLYALFTALAGYLVFYKPAWYAGPADLDYIIRSAFFVPSYRPEPFGGLWPILVPGWTLNLEIVFYAVFGIMLFFRRTALLSSLTLIAIYVISWANAETYTWAAAYSFFGGVILEFIIGMAIGWRYLAGDRLPNWFAAILVSFGFALLFALVGKTHSSIIDSGGPAALIVLGAVNLRFNYSERWRKLIEMLGHLSYPMYLCHNFIIQGLTLQLRKHGFEAGSIPGPIFLATIAALVIGASWAVHILIESPIDKTVSNPLTRWMDAALKRRPRRVITPAE